MTIQIIKTENYEEMSRIAANKVIKTIESKPNAVLGLAAGSTPEGLYKLLIEDHQQSGTSYKYVKTVYLDKYIGLEKEDKNSYFSFMWERLFKYLDIPLENIYFPNGVAADIEAEAIRYENFINKIGGIDLQILGIGHNGLIPFNEPGTPFKSKTHVIELIENTRQAHARYFDSVDAVPTHTITMGMQSIMDSKEIILLAFGSSKAEAIKRLVDGEILEQYPASILREHSKMTIIADQAALLLV